MFQQLSLGLDHKRKIELDENVEKKKPRREIDDELKLFNYTTGTYVIGNVTDEPSQDDIKSKEEPVFIQKYSIVKKADIKDYSKAGEDLVNLQERKKLTLSTVIVETPVISNIVEPSIRDSEVKEESNVSILENLLRGKCRSKHFRSRFYPPVCNSAPLAKRTFTYRDGKSNATQKFTNNHKNIVQNDSSLKNISCSSTSSNNYFQTATLSNSERPNNDMTSICQTERINNVKKHQSGCIVLKCFDCDRQFDYEENLKSHAILYHWKSTFKCGSHTARHFSQNCSKCIYESLLTAVQKSKMPTPKKNGLCARQKIVETTIEESENSITIESNVNRNESSESTKRLHRETGDVVANPAAMKKKRSNSILLDLLTGRAMKQILKMRKVLPPEDDITVNSQSNLQVNGVEKKSEASIKGVKPWSKKMPSKCISPANDISDISLSAKEATEPNNISSENITLVPHIEENISNIEIINLTDEDSLKLDSNKYVCFSCQGVIFDNLSQFKNHITMHVGSHFCCMHHSVTKRKDCLKCFYETALSNIKDSVKNHPACEFSTYAEPKLPGQLQEKNVDFQKLADNLKNIDQNGCNLKNISCSSTSSSNFQATELSNGEESSNDLINVYQKQSINNVNKHETGCVVLKCFDCDRQFHDKESLKSHAVLYHLKSTFKCDAHTTKHFSQECSKCIYESLLTAIQRRKMPTSKKNGLCARQTVVETAIEKSENSITIESNLNKNESSESRKRLHEDIGDVVDSQAAIKQNCSNSILLNLLTGQAMKRYSKMQKMAPPEDDITVNSQSKLQDNSVKKSSKESIDGVIPKVPLSNRTSSECIVNEHISPASDISLCNIEAAAVNSQSNLQANRVERSSKASIDGLIPKVLLSNRTSSECIVNERHSPASDISCLSDKEATAINSQSNVQAGSIEKNSKASTAGVKPKVSLSNRTSSECIINECNYPASDISLYDKEAAAVNSRSTLQAGRVEKTSKANIDSVKPKIPLSNRASSECIVNEYNSPVNNVSSSDEKAAAVNSQSNLQTGNIDENSKASLDGVKPKVPLNNRPSAECIVNERNSPASDISLSDKQAAEPNNMSMENNPVVPYIEENISHIEEINIMDEDPPEQVINKYVCFDCQNVIFNDLSQFSNHIVMHVGSHFCCMYHPIFKSRDCPKCFYETRVFYTKEHVLNCPTCEFITRSKSTLGKHLQEENGCKNWMTKKRNPEELKCFHCRYLTLHKKFLIYHAANHINGSFSCYKHAHRKDAKCIECIYEDSLNAAKRDILYCEKCGFRTVIIEVFEIHMCDISTANNVTSKNYRYWERKDFSTTTNDELRQYAIKHFKSNLRYNSNNSCVDVNAKELENRVFVCKTCNFGSLSSKDYNHHKLEGCLVSQNIQSCISDRISVKNVNVNAEKEISTGKFQCLHCEYKCSTKNMLKYHCKQHYYEPFNCDDHIESTQADCQKCIFQCLLKSVKKSLFTCDKCNLKTFNGFYFDSHECKSDTDDLTFNCFDCDMICETIQVLKQHVVDHAGSEFNCENHQLFVSSCRRCIYESVVKSMQINTMFICRNCDFNAYSLRDLLAHEGETNCQKKLTEERKMEIEPLKIYACLKCDFSHHLLSSMKQHIELHSEDKFKCDKHMEPEYKYCPKCFCAKMLSHKFKNVCFDCNDRPNFPLKSKLKQHVSERHPDSYFACTQHFNNKDHFCDLCAYQDVVKETLGMNYINLFCWHCKGKLFSYKSTLEKHIRECHDKRKFRCSKHLDKRQTRCNKCLYQTLVQNVSAISIIKKVGTVFRCFDCEYSSKTLKLFRKHVRVEHKNSKFECMKHRNLPIPDYENCPACFYYVIMMNKIRDYLRCYECSYHPRFDYIKSLKKHLVEKHRKKRSFVCPRHTTDSVNCTKCWFSEQLFDFKESQDITFQCFECNFKHEELKSFQQHVRTLHQRSEFKCAEHFGLTGVDFNDCPKCFYFVVASSKSSRKESRRQLDQRTVIRCYECCDPKPFWTESNLRNHLLSKHMPCSFVCPQHTDESINCGKCWFQRFAESTAAESEEVSLKCFECAFSTRIFTLYKNHVRKHEMSTFKCNEHPVDVAECQKCFYILLVNSNRKLRCFECELRPVFPDTERLLSHIYQNHKKCVFVCRDHTSSNDNCVKCLFKVFVKKAFSFVCLDCDRMTLPNKSELEKHIKELHLNTQFTCALHPLSPQADTCEQCAYEDLVRECINSRISEEPAVNTSNGTVLIFRCFDCDYRSGTDYSMKNHIREKHIDSTFMCTKHSLGEISATCDECIYERLALLSKIEP